MKNPAPLTCIIRFNYDSNISLFLKATLNCVYSEYIFGYQLICAMC